MNKNKEKVPKIRFPGFTEPWEQRKLGDVVSYIVDNRGKNPTYYCSEGIPVIDNFMIKNTLYPELGTATRFIDEELYQNFIRKYNEIDDILLTLVGNGIGNISLFPADKAVIIQNTLGLRTDENKRFLFFLLMSKNQEIVKLDRGMAQPSIRQDEILDISIKIPKMEEQEKIGTYFSNLDNLITLHQRKLNHLKDKKKGLLQKMFPKNGELVPELRFPEFTDPWEQRKVGEFLTESKIKGSDGSKAKKLTVKLWRKGIVPKEEIYQGSSATQYYVRKSGQFMYGKLDFLNQAFGIVPPELDGYESTLDSPAFDFKDGINSGFFLEYISLKRFYKYQGNTANGSRKAKRIHADTFFEMPISVPRHDEQKKIGSFFQNIDNLITGLAIINYTINIRS